ncbi:MAG TPA: class F sortase [Ilumatobacteraceae bacterium]|nr:class F sortase [Ilumatobacteraceae bacterium]
MLTFTIVAALLVGGGLAIAGFATRGGGDEVVLDVDDAVATVTPSTVPPLADPADPSSESAGSEAALSPLAKQLGERSSAIPEDRAPRARPVGLQIDTIDVARFPIRAIGLEPDGQMEIPDETEIGWYRYGATAGQPGATVLAAHVNWNRVPGPFARLGRVEPGDQIEVALDDGTLRRYEVVERAVYGKLELPRERLWRNTGPEELVLITCGGDYNPEIRRYRENIVVYAVPIG